MPETRIISTKTSFSVNGFNITILTEYDPNQEPFILQAFLADEPGTLSNVDYSDGDLMIQYIDSAIVQLNNQGELIIISDKANLYSINSNGELEYNEP